MMDKTTKRAIFALWAMSVGTGMGALALMAINPYGSLGFAFASGALFCSGIVVILEEVG